MWSPCSSTSSPTFTMAVSSSGGDDLHEPGEEPGGADPAATTRRRGQLMPRSRPESRSMSASTIIVTRSSKRRARLPAEHRLGLGGVADEQVDLGRAHEPLVDA